MGVSSGLCGPCIQPQLAGPVPVHPPIFSFPRCGQTHGAEAFLKGLSCCGNLCFGTIVTQAWAAFLSTYPKNAFTQEVDWGCPQMAVARVSAL